MTSTITNLHQKLQVAEVEDVIVTDIVETDGVYQRSIRILGAVDGSDDPVEIVEIVLSGDSIAKVEFTAPSYDY